MLAYQAFLMVGIFLTWNIGLMMTILIMEVDIKFLPFPTLALFWHMIVAILPQLLLISQSDWLICHCL